MQSDPFSNRAKLRSSVVQQDAASVAIPIFDAVLGGTPLAWTGEVMAGSGVVLVAHIRGVLNGKSSLLEHGTSENLRARNLISRVPLMGESACTED
jgi:hypothetical protein